LVGAGIGTVLLGILVGGLLAVGVAISRLAGRFRARR
jgi:hypothetical protein